MKGNIKTEWEIKTNKVWKSNEVGWTKTEYYSKETGEFFALFARAGA